MSLDASDLKAFGQLSAEFGQALWGATVTIAGIDYPATAPDPRVEEGLEGYAGAEKVGELVVRILKTDLPAKPAVDILLLRQGMRWKIRSVTGDNPCDAEWILRCDPKN